MSFVGGRVAPEGLDLDTETGRHAFAPTHGTNQLGTVNAGERGAPIMIFR